jgi:transposase InsO family protein
MAIENRKHLGLFGLIHHSDRSVQYASDEYVDLLENYGIKISMSRSGNPYDNAFMESFYKTLKNEEVYLNEYETIEDAYKNIKRFIDSVYNKKRLHSAIGYIPPEEFEINLFKKKKKIKKECILT